VTASAINNSTWPKAEVGREAV